MKLKDLIALIRKRGSLERFISIVIKIWNLYRVIEIVELGRVRAEVLKGLKVLMLNIGKCKLSTSKINNWWNRKVKG